MDDNDNTCMNLRYEFVATSNMYLCGREPSHVHLEGARHRLEGDVVLVLHLGKRPEGCEDEHPGQGLPEQVQQLPAVKKRQSIVRTFVTFAEKERKMI